MTRLLLLALLQLVLFVPTSRAEFQKGTLLVLSQKDLWDNVQTLVLFDKVLGKESIRLESPKLSEGQLHLEVPVGVYDLQLQLAGSKTLSMHARDIEMLQGEETEAYLDSGVEIECSAPIQSMGWVLSPIDPAMTLIDVSEGPPRGRYPAMPGAYTVNVRDSGKLIPTGESLFLFPGKVLSIDVCALFRKAAARRGK